LCAESRSPFQCPVTDSWPFIPLLLLLLILFSFLSLPQDLSFSITTVLTFFSVEIDSLTPTLLPFIFEITLAELTFALLPNHTRYHKALHSQTQQSLWKNPLHSYWDFKSIDCSDISHLHTIENNESLDFQPLSKCSSSRS
jgi:hypothetical protein